MPIPRCCSHPSCPYYHDPPRHWFVRYGHYHTRAHGTIQRYRCRACRRTCSDQSESLHFFAKLHLPLVAVWRSLLAGASLREVARRYRISPQGVQNAVLRLGRQAMSAHLRLLEALNPCAAVAYDGLRSCVSSHDYPCELVTVVEPRGQMILTMHHLITRRGGTMSEAQRERVRSKEAVWRPKAGTTKRAIALVQRELWEYVRAPQGGRARIDTDEHPLYRALLRREAVARHLRRAGQLEHVRTSGRAARSYANALFGVNYVDRLVRHRLKEHTRESIAIGRQATMQMHRAWMFAFDHNCLREYRVKRPQLGTHAEQGVVERRVVQEVRREVFRRRLRVSSEAVPETIRLVWMGQLATPPLRWRVGQRGSSVRVPAYAIRDLRAGYQHAC